MTVRAARTAPGQMVGQYRIDELLGRGGMGVVYRGHHAALDRTVAIKLMSALAAEPSEGERFLREARAVSRLRHANVLAVFDYGEEGGVPYMVTEFIAGGSLEDRLRGEGLTRSQTLGILRGLAAGVDYAHQAGILHRDIKPANVLLGDHGAPILADFGLAKSLGTLSPKTQSNVITGTVAYMAPEQAGGGIVGPATDVYSFAIVAFELLTGELPFQGDNLLEILMAQVRNEPPAPAASTRVSTPRWTQCFCEDLPRIPRYAGRPAWPLSMTWRRPSTNPHMSGNRLRHRVEGSPGPPRPPSSSPF